MDKESHDDKKPLWHCFRPTETEEVPELPGLYAWHLNFINPQEFSDPVNFLTKYEPYVNALNSDSEEEQKGPQGGKFVANLSGSGQFGDQYAAKLRITHKSIEIDAGSSRSQPDDAKKVAAQKILQNLFNDTFQIFAAPLYIGKTDNLKRRFEEHLLAVPNEPDSTFGLAVVAIAQDRTDDASRLLHAAFIAFGKDKPRDQARVLVRQSDLAMRADDPAKAEELLAQAATLAPTFPEIWAKTARVKDRLGKTAQAEIARENERKTREALTATAEGNS